MRNCSSAALSARVGRVSRHTSSNSLHFVIRPRQLVRVTLSRVRDEIPSVGARLKWNFKAWLVWRKSLSTQYILNGSIPAPNPPDVLLHVAFGDTSSIDRQCIHQIGKVAPRKAGHRWPDSGKSSLRLFEDQISQSRMILLHIASRDRGKLTSSSRKVSKWKWQVKPSTFFTNPYSIRRLGYCLFNSVTMSQKFLEEPREQPSTSEDAVLFISSGYQNREILNLSWRKISTPILCWLTHGTGLILHWGFP